MNPIARERAKDVFRRATEEGDARSSAVVLRMLEQLAPIAKQDRILDTESLVQEILEELATSEESGIALEPKSDPQERRVVGLRWVIQELKSWTPQTSNAWPRLQILFAALTAFDFGCAGLDEIFSLLPEPVKRDGSRHLLQSAAAPKESSFAASVQAISLEGNFEQLEIETRFLRAQISAEVRVAVNLLWKVNPDVLCEVIDQRRDAFLSYAVCQILGPASLAFSRGVQDGTFKFFSAKTVSDLPFNDANAEALSAFEDVLVHAATTPHWRAWLKALYRHPRVGRLSEAALSSALARLDDEKWEAVIESIELWTQEDTAAAVAAMHLKFLQAVGNEAARKMWSLAHSRWNDWDYGAADSNSYMFSPLACSFDFAVAMHFASLTPADVLEEEQRLARVIECLEQEWFPSVSELVTQRNRLLSRLRLVRHGQAIAAEATTSALPSPPQPGSEYESLRYHYHDVNAQRRTV